MGLAVEFLAVDFLGAGALAAGMIWMLSGLAALGLACGFSSAQTAAQPAAACAPAPVCSRGAHC
ncbi:MAG: hypothetical protein ACKPHU_34465, partial [Planctomycetaceae bacterium]